MLEIVFFTVYLHSIPVKENTTFLGANFRIRLWKDSIAEVWCCGLIFSISFNSLEANRTAVSCSHAAVPTHRNNVIKFNQFGDNE